MEDAGSGPPAPTDRRYDNRKIWETTERIIDMGVVSEQLGFDSYWLTEHHFQYEGYEVIPNGILIGTILAERTERIKIGMAFNVVPQWHPLRLAEDFATLHNISGGRGILGVGRGTVPREAETLGAKIGSFDNPDKAAADQENREHFEEAMQIIKMALDQETFSFHGKHYDFPPPGRRGGGVDPGAPTAVSVRDVAGHHLTADSRTGSQVGLGWCLVEYQSQVPEDVLGALCGDLRGDPRSHARAG